MARERAPLAMKVPMWLLALAPLLLGASARLRQRDVPPLTPEMTSKLAEQRAEMAKEIMDARDEQKEEILKALNTSQSQSAEGITQELERRQVEAVTKIKHEVPHAKKALWQAWIKAENRELNLTMHDIMHEREKEYKIMDGIKEEADRMNDKHVEEIRAAAGNVSHILAHNAAGEGIIAARQRTAILQNDLDYLRAQVSQSNAKAQEAAAQTLVVAREVRGASKRMPQSRMEEVVSMASAAEAQAYDMQTTILQVRRKADQAQAIANQGQTEASQALGLAREAERLARDALQKAQLNAQNLRELKEQADTANRDATQALEDSKTAAVQVGVNA